MIVDRRRLLLMARLVPRLLLLFGRLFAGVIFANGQRLRVALWADMHAQTTLPRETAALWLQHHSTTAPQQTYRAR